MKTKENSTFTLQGIPLLHKTTRLQTKAKTYIIRASEICRIFILVISSMTKRCLCCVMS
jgi:hypothetical protein